jgi:hypothetical protein
MDLFTTSQWDKEALQIEVVINYGDKTKSVTRTVSLTRTLNRN